MSYSLLPCLVLRETEAQGRKGLARLPQAPPSRDRPSEGGQEENLEQESSGEGEGCLRKWAWLDSCSKKH